MASKLGLYNAALSLIGEAEIASLTETAEARYVLDRKYDDATRYCLECGLWNFATRAIEAHAAPSVEPTFGYQFAMTRPNDWLRIAGVWTDPTERNPNVDYAFEQGYIYANVDPLYIRYVSSDPQYGMDLGKWPMAFQRFVEAHLAAEICSRLTNNDQKHQELRKLENNRMLAAENKNAMDLPARFPPMGSWAQSRMTGFRGSKLSGPGRGL